MIKHIVFWKIAPAGDASQHQEVYEQFAAKTKHLQTITPQIREAHVALNVVGGDAFHICIDSVFDSLADLDAYINHPEHLKVREYMNSVTYDKTVFDYEF